MQLSNNEKECLRAWEDTDEEADVLPFAFIDNGCNLETRLIRRTVRALARKGLTVLTRCFDDEGFIRGSGYSLTTAGRKEMEKLYWPK